jgi:hypothetical protein
MGRTTAPVPFFLEKKYNKIKLFQVGGRGLTSVDGQCHRPIMLWCERDFIFLKRTIASGKSGAFYSPLDKNDDGTPESDLTKNLDELDD